MTNVELVVVHSIIHQYEVPYLQISTVLRHFIGCFKSVTDKTQVFLDMLQSTVYRLGEGDVSLVQLKRDSLNFSKHYYTPNIIFPRCEPYKVLYVPLFDTKLHQMAEYPDLLPVIWV